MALGRAAVIRAANKNAKARQEQRDRTKANNQQTGIQGRTSSDVDIEMQDYGSNQQNQKNNEDPNKLQYEDENDDASTIHIQHINLKENSENRIVFRKYPCTLWVMGSVIIIIGLYLIYHLSLGDIHGGIFDGFKEGHWWQWMIAFGIIVLGICFLYAGKVESTVFDKNKRLIILKKTSIICRSKVRSFNMDEMRDIRAYKKGHAGINFYTLHYEIIVDFKQIAPVKVLESQNSDKIKKQLVHIKNFIGHYCTEDDIRIIDESTRL